MKKTFFVSIFFCMSFLLTSCFQEEVEEWNTFSNEYIEYVEISGYVYSEDGHGIKVRVNFPEELFEKRIDIYYIYVKLYFDVEYYDHTTRNYYTINDVSGDILIRQSGECDYYFYLNVSQHKQGVSDSSVKNITYKKAEYKVEFTGDSVLDLFSPEEIYILKVSLFPTIFSFLATTMFVIILCIKINKNITKQYYKNKYGKL